MSSHGDQDSISAELQEGPHRSVAIGGARLATWRFGRGPDLLLIHGWPLGAATFRHLAPLLADDFTVHVVDLPGAGATARDPSVPLDMVSQARTLRRALSNSRS